MRRHLPLLLPLLLLWAAPAGAITLVRAVAAQRVTAGEPEGVADRFDLEGGQVYVHLLIDEAGPDTPVVLRWHRGGRFLVSDRLTARRPGRWRTWVRRRFRPGDAGQWRVEIRGPDDALLDTVSFTVGDAPAEAPPQPAQAPASVAGPLPAVATAPPPPSAGGQCRALLNLRTSPSDAAPRYVVADVRFGAWAGVTHTDGLVVHDGERARLLAVQTHSQTIRGPDGLVDRTWDELVAAPLPTGEPTVLLSFPASLPPPSGATRLRRVVETNRIEVVSTLGPYLGLYADLRGLGPDGDFDRSRYLTLNLDGGSSDLARLVGDGLRVLMREAGLRSLAEAPGPVDADGHDYRRAAFVLADGVEVRALLPCCGAGQHVAARAPLHAPPPAVRPFTPDAKGLFWHGDCAVGLSGPRLVARIGDGPVRAVRAPSLVPFGLLGVVWLRPEDPLHLDQVRAALARLQRGR